MKRNLPSLLLLLAAMTACWWIARLPRQQAAGESSQPADSESQPATGVPARLASTGSASHSRDASELIRASIRGLRSAEGLEAAVKLDIEWLGQNLSGAGVYIQEGQGTPKARWDLEFQQLPDSLRMVQLFDGRFHYLFREQGDARSLTYVDEYKIPRMEVSGTAALPGPAGWFGTGSLPTLLEQLASAFDFEVVSTSSRLSRSGRAMELAVVAGSWRPEALRQLLREQVDPARITPEISWDDLPAQIPRSVELVLGSDDYLECFPYQITLRFGEPHSQGHGAGGGAISWKLHHVTRRASFDPEAFKISTHGAVAEDLTEDFLARLEMYLLYPVK